MKLSKYFLKQSSCLPNFTLCDLHEILSFFFCMKRSKEYVRGNGLIQRCLIQEKSSNLHELKWHLCNQKKILCFSEITLQVIISSSLKNHQSNWISDTIYLVWHYVVCLDVFVYIYMCIYGCWHIIIKYINTIPRNMYS